MREYKKGAPVKTTSLENPASISRLKLFIALSRTPHAVLDLAAPTLSAVLWLGAFPSAETAGLGLLTAFSGYNAVYALNDLKDYRIDREKLSAFRDGERTQDLDGIFLRHPLAQGKLGYREGAFWAAAWGASALGGAFLLNPFCIVIFLAACLLEVIYCSLLRITHLRGIISGVVKTSGPLAAVFAVDPAPPAPFLLLLFLWLFSWEIGGQNIPNDWSDVEEDRRIGARTIPVRFGLGASIRIILGCLIISLVLSMAVYWVLPNPMSLMYIPGALLCGIYFLFIPGLRLYRGRTTEDAFRLFNRASYYPACMLLIVFAGWVF